MSTIIKYFVSMTLYITFLMALVSFMRKHYRVAHGVWIGSLLTIPVWVMGGVVGWFRWAKNLSVIIPTIFTGFVRIANYEKLKGKYWESLQKNWTMKVLYGVLFLNIFEATLKDFTLGNYFNSFTGLMLCLTIPFVKKGNWKIDEEAPGDLLVYTSLAWNFLYTTWNACFVYGESPVYFASSLCILLAAELYPILKKRHELYIMARIYTLATHLIIRSCFVGLFPSVMNSGSWYNAGVMNAWGIINAILVIPYVIYFIKENYSSKKLQKANEEN